MFVLGEDENDQNAVHVHAEVNIAQVGTPTVIVPPPPVVAAEPATAHADVDRLVGGTQPTSWAASPAARPRAVASAPGPRQAVT